MTAVMTAVQQQRCLGPVSYGSDGSVSESVEEFRVNADQYSGSQYQPSVGALSNGGFVVTWRDDSGGSHDDGTGTGSS